jgi:molybdate transport system substrate-binding protein
MKKVLGLAVMLLAAILLIAPAAFSAEIRVMSTTAVKDAVNDVLPQFQKVSGHTVKPIWDGTAVVTRRIAAGEVVDIVIVPASAVDNLIKEGKLAAGSRLDFVKSTIGVAVRPGAPRPDISSTAALKTSLLAAKSILLSAGPSGAYLTGLFNKMGIADAIKPKIKHLAPGQMVGEALLRGEGDVGFTQISEFLMFKAVDYIGPLPADIQFVTVYSIGVHAKAQSKEAALTLIKFLASPETAKAIRNRGMEPAFK